MQNPQTRPDWTCPICSAPLVPTLEEGWRLTGRQSRRTWFQGHCEQNHKDYLTWKKSMRRLARILGVVSAILVSTVISILLFTFNIHLPPGRATGAFFALLLIVAFFIPLILIDRWGILKFKREWIARGGFPAPPLFQV